MKTDLLNCVDELTKFPVVDFDLSIEVLQEEIAILQHMVSSLQQLKILSEAAIARRAAVVESPPVLPVSAMPEVADNSTRFPVKEEVVSMERPAESRPESSPTSLQGKIEGYLKAFGPRSLQDIAKNYGVDVKEVRRELLTGPFTLKENKWWANAALRKSASE